MTPAARVQAAIEILDEVIASARDDGPPADSIVTRYFKIRRYAGSKDRRAVRELVFRAIRAVAERPVSGRAAMLAMVESDAPLLDLFGKPRGPEAVGDISGVVAENLAGRGSTAPDTDLFMYSLRTGQKYSLPLRASLVRLEATPPMFRYG